METADAMVSSGLKVAGYEYVNIDDCWSSPQRDKRTGELVPDPDKFPDGIGAVAEYVHKLGLKIGIYGSRGGTTCGGRPGSGGHAALDAATFARWGVDYVKLDSCKGGTFHPDAASFDDPEVAWQEYVAMKNALNSTGRPIWFSITERVLYNDSEWHAAMHCIRPPRPAGYPNAFGAFTVRPWVQRGKDVPALANSFLIEYCNNEPTWGYTNGYAGPGASAAPGGFLSQLDSQQLLTYDNLTVPGAYSDADMLEVCNSNPHDPAKTMTVAEQRAQFSTFAILASPLILGNDLRSLRDLSSQAAADCLEIITNREIIALNQNAHVARARLVYQYPLAEWPNAYRLPPSGPSVRQPKDSGDVDRVDAAVTVNAPPGRRRYPGDGLLNITVQAWAKPLADGSVGVLVLNRGAAPASVEVTWSMLGLPTAIVGVVRDLWAHTDRGDHTGSYTCAAVASHDVCALRVTPRPSVF